MERTLCIIKPHAVDKGHADAIIILLEEKGFFICQRNKVVITKETQKYTILVSRSDFINIWKDHNQAELIIGDIIGK